MLMILVSEIAGSSMDAIVRFLQQGGNNMHPFQVRISISVLWRTKKYDPLQVIVARMGTTFVLSSIYMWWNKVPDFPLGKPAVRGWLILRALFGFFGLFCLYCKSLFLSPWICGPKLT
jgi:hypothetical protein